MKKSQFDLLRIASKFKNKYAEGQNLQQIIENAASYGEQSANGIMNFPAQLKQDQAGLTINVTIDSGALGGRNVQVSSPVVEPSQFASRYAKLPEQIKKYLDRNLEYFPQVPNGTTTLSYPAPKAEVASY